MVAEILVLFRVYDLKTKDDDMKRNLVIIFAFVLSLGQTLFAQSKVEFTVTPQLSQNFGLTEYIMDISIPYDKGIYSSSQNNFPIAAVLCI